MEILDITSSGFLELSSGSIHMSHLALLNGTLRWAIPGHNHRTLIGILLELFMEPLQKTFLLGFFLGCRLCRHTLLPCFSDLVRMMERLSRGKGGLCEHRLMYAQSKQYLLLTFRFISGSLYTIRKGVIAVCVADLKRSIRATGVIYSYLRIFASSNPFVLHPSRVTCAVALSIKSING